MIELICFCGLVVLVLGLGDICNALNRIADIMENNKGDEE